MKLIDKVQIVVCVWVQCCLDADHACIHSSVFCCNISRSDSVLDALHILSLVLVSVQGWVIYDASFSWMDALTISNLHPSTRI